MIKNPMFIENWTRVFALIIIGKNYILLSIDVNWKDEKQHIDKPESKSQAQAQSSGLDWIHSNLDWIQSEVKPISLSLHGNHSRLEWFISRVNHQLTLNLQYLSQWDIWEYNSFRFKEKILLNRIKTRPWDRVRSGLIHQPPTT